jgi:hypothetical protein
MVVAALTLAASNFGNGVSAQEGKYKFDQPDRGWSEAKGCPKISIVKANKPDEKGKKYPKCVDSEEEANAFRSMEQLATLAFLYNNADMGGASIQIVMDIPVNPYLNCNGYWANIGAQPYYFNDVTSSAINYCQGMDLYPDADLGGAPAQFCEGSIGYVGDYINDRTTSVRFRGYLAPGCA